ncbi:hypothetical protein C943_00391 [Mariniradius saccharolyticus AK6]|uniref:Uncharacterized protein n=1 Tax=Mariniradius saccharolyticus AK6 TaxID=1239962 RepID=M7XE01_9BACT|nr:hypothetical protein C943_00391 [Mariniradius saccharolyticus AK6]
MNKFCTPFGSERTELYANWPEITVSSVWYAFGTKVFSKDAMHVICPFCEQTNY